MATMAFFSSRAQTHLPVSSMNFSAWSPFGFHNFTDSSDKKWQLSAYSGISAGAAFYNGGSSTMLSAPVGLQLMHPLNNNLYVFAGVSAGPSFYSVSPSFSNMFLNKSYPGNPYQNAYGLGLNTRAELGLMYINDAKTFSISGSIGVEQSSYPYFPQQQRPVQKNNR